MHEGAPSPSLALPPSPTGPMHAAVEAGVDRNLVGRIHEMTLGWVIAYVDDPAQTYAGAVALN